MIRSVRTKVTAIILTLIFLLMSLLSACGTDKPAQTTIDLAAETTTTAASLAEAATTTAAATVERTTKALADGDVLVRTSFTAGEFTDDIIAKCEADLPGIKVERVEADDTKLMSMIAAGTAPDIVRVYAAQTLPMWVTRGICVSIQDYVDASPFIDEDDLLPICDTFRWDGQKSGQGPLYGIPRDWNLDVTVFINKKQFEKQGVPIPDEKTPLTIAEYVDISKQLYEENDDGSVKVYGSGESLSFNLMLIQSMMNQQGKSIWSDDYKRVNINNDEVREIFSYIYDITMSGSKVSLINPALDWDGNIFRAGMLGMFQQGYWFAGIIRGFSLVASQMESQEVALDDVMLLPAIIAKDGATRISTCTAACGGILLKQSRDPDAAWRVFEWFLGNQQQAIDRAKSGWGLPSYRSLIDHLPNETEMDKQIIRVIMDEIDNSAQLYAQMNPFIDYAEAERLITNHINPIYFGESTIDEALPQLERDLQSLVDEGMEISGIS